MRRRSSPTWRAAGELIGVAALFSCGSTDAPGGASGPADASSGNRTRTVELRDAAFSPDATLGPADALALCRALRARYARLWTAECLERLENTIRQTGTYLTITDEAEARISCATQDFYTYHCSEERDPAAAAAECAAPYTPSCMGITVRELDDCLADREAHLSTIPPCDKMTIVGQSTPRLTVPSCQNVFAACPDLLNWQ